MRLRNVTDGSLHQGEYMRRRGGRPNGAAGRERMTARESEVLGWVAAGKSDWAIGQILHISGKTVPGRVNAENKKLYYFFLTRRTNTSPFRIFPLQSSN